MASSLSVVDVTEFYSARGGVRAHLDLKGQVSCQLGHHHLVLAPGPREAIATPSVKEHPTSTAGLGSRRVIRLGGPALPYDRNYHLLVRLGDLRRVLLSENPDVVEINSPYVAAWAVHNLPRNFVRLKTFWWHSDFIDTWLGTFRAVAQRADRTRSLEDALWKWVRFVTSDSAAVFAASRGQADKLSARGVRNVVHLPFGIDKETFSPRAKSDILRNTWKRAGDGSPTVVVAVGRMSREKQWEVVLDAFLRFRTQRDAILLAFGDGPERQRLQKRVAHCKDVRFMGFEHDKGRLAAALASADVLLHGCPHETFGLGVAQAIACGLPVVVPDAGGVAEQVTGPHGARYRSQDSAHAAQCLLAITDVASPSQVDRVRAVTTVQSAAHHFEKLFDIYRALGARTKAAS